MLRTQCHKIKRVIYAWGSKRDIKIPLSRICRLIPCKLNLFLYCYYQVTCGEILTNTETWRWQLCIPEAG